MTALRRLLMGFPGVALVAAALVVPAAAQDADAPVDVTAAPPPTADSVGPASLRNFSLGGPAQRPAQQTQPAPTTNTQPSSPAPTQAERDVPSSATRPTVQTRPAESVATPTAVQGTPATVEPQLTLPEAAAVAPATDEPANFPPAADSTATPRATSSILPWLAALIAAVLGAGALWWMRRQRQQRYNDPGRLAFAAPQPDVDVSPAPRAPVPQPAPRPAGGVAPAPAPAPTPAPTPPKPDSGLIVSRALKPLIQIEFQPDRLLVSDKEVAIQFDTVISNGGAAPAREVMIESALFTAHAGQDQDIARFFMEPKNSSDRIAAIPPMSRIALKSVVRLPIDQVHKFKVEDRELFVPLVGFNIVFNSSAGEGQTSASFLVGRGTSEDSKLAPFALEKGPRIINGLSSRQHSTGLNR